MLASWQTKAGGGGGGGGGGRGGKSHEAAERSVYCIQLGCSPHNLTLLMLQLTMCMHVISLN